MLFNKTKNKTNLEVLAYEKHLELPRGWWVISAHLGLSLILPLASCLSVSLSFCFDPCTGSIEERRGAWIVQHWGPLLLPGFLQWPFCSTLILSFSFYKWQHCMFHSCEGKLWRSHRMFVSYQDSVNTGVSYKIVSLCFPWFILQL